MIHIEQQDGQGTAILDSLLPEAREMLIEHPAVFCARERIVLGKIRDEALFEKAGARASFDMSGGHCARNHGHDQEHGPL
jgi:hypothetical protein